MGSLGLTLGLKRFRRGLQKLKTVLPIQGEGLLYNKKVLKNGKIIAPPGWRVINTDDFTGLIDYLGGQEAAPGKLKKQGAWNDPEATNESGFSVVPVGIRDNTGKFSGRNTLTAIWIDNQ